MKGRTLCKVIALTESNDNPYALRFEHAYYQKLKKRHYSEDLVRQYNQCSKDTAYMIMGTSWGKFQILGVNLYNPLGFRNSIVSYLNDTVTQVRSFKDFVELITGENYEDVANNIIKELDDLLKKRQSMLIQDFREYLANELPEKMELVHFIRRYNGAKYGTSQFLAYLNRMLYHYKMLK